MAYGKTRLVVRCVVVNTRGHVPLWMNVISSVCMDTRLLGQDVPDADVKDVHLLRAAINTAHMDLKLMIGVASCANVKVNT